MTCRNKENARDGFLCLLVRVSAREGEGLNKCGGGEREGKKERNI